MDILFAAAVGILCALGVFQMLRRDLIKAAMGLSILFTAVNLFFISAGAFESEVPAYVDQFENGQPSDPLVQAMVLTAVVVSFASYALLLSFITVVSNRFETLDSDETDQLKF